MTTIPSLPFNGQQLRDTLVALDEAVENKEDAGAAADAVAEHVADADSHPQYQTQAEGDARYATAAQGTDARTPTAHKSSHATGGSDALTPGDIGAATAAQGAKADTAVQPAALSDYLTAAAAAAGYQPLDSDLTAIAALSTTSYGRAFLALADAAAGRTALGLGTAATTDASAYATAAQGAKADTAVQPAALSSYQPLDSDLTAIAALTTTSFGRSLLTQADEAATRTTIGAGTSNVVVSDATPQTPGTAAAGTSADAARADHRHALPAVVSTSAAGLAPATGTPSGKYLKDDGTWTDVPAGSPAGTGTEIQYRNGTAFGAIPNSSVDTATGAVTLARLIAAANGAASAPGVTLTGTWFTGGTATTTKPHVLIEPSGTTSTAWSTSGTGFGVNAPSGFTGNLLDLQVNGTSKLLVDKDGRIGTSSSGFGVVGFNGGFYYANGYKISFGDGSIYVSKFSSPSSPMLATAAIGTTDPSIRTGIELALYQDASGAFAQRNGGTNATPVPQTFRVYNWSTDNGSANYERGYLGYASNQFRIGTEKGSTSGDATPLLLQTDGTTRLTINASGSFTVADAQDIALGTTTGTKIGTATTQKLGFYNKTPVVQPTAVAEITTTATTGTLPTADGTVTIANASTPTVSELLEYCVELEAKLEAALGRLRDLGLIAT